jgi:hypothetical protein
MKSAEASSSFSPPVLSNRLVERIQISSGMLAMRVSVMELGRFTGSHSRSAPKRRQNSTKLSSTSKRESNEGRHARRTQQLPHLWTLAASRSIWISLEMGRNCWALRRKVSLWRWSDVENLDDVLACLEKLVALPGIELEALSRRERSESLLPKSRAERGTST